MLPLLSGLVIGAATADAQLPEESTPSAVAVAALSALDRGDGRGVAARTHPQVIESARRRLLLTVIAQAGYAHSKRGDERRSARRDSSGLSGPGPVPSDLIAKYAKTPVRGSETPGSSRPRTLAEMASLPPDELFAWWITQTHETASTDPDMPAATFLPVSAVAEGDSLVHVLYRERSKEARYDEPWRVDVLSLKRDGGRWRILLEDSALFPPDALAALTGEKPPAER
ncbi:MAG: hypothetical protein M3068_03080 [Gemmatimonadota bacterium]|nr:hypothetical protein [Gemmatimonadota bacterium]